MQRPPPGAAHCEAVCSSCGALASRVHRRDVRTLANLPQGGLTARLQFLARRLRCSAVGCARLIFAERLEAAAAWRAEQGGWTIWRTIWAGSGRPPWRELRDAANGAGDAPTT